MCHFISIINDIFMISNPEPLLRTTRTLIFIFCYIVIYFLSKRVRMTALYFDLEQRRNIHSSRIFINFISYIIKLC